MGTNVVKMMVNSEIDRYLSKKHCDNVKLYFEDKIDVEDKSILKKLDDLKKKYFGDETTEKDTA